MPSRSMRFLDRGEAGRLLAERLAAISTPSPCVVAGIPRGGVLVAAPVAERLGAPLTVAYARKVTPYPGSELAIGAVDEDGEVLLNPAVAPALHATENDLAESRERSLAEIRRQQEAYTATPLERLLPGHGVVLVDDGLATGLTMQAAVNFVRRHGASQVVVATPCSSAGAVRRFRKVADLFVSLIVDPDFIAVGSYYLSFPSVSDQEIAAALKHAQGLVGARRA